MEPTSYCFTRKESPPATLLRGPNASADSLTKSRPILAAPAAVDKELGWFTTGAGVEGADEPRGGGKTSDLAIDEADAFVTSTPRGME